MRKIFLLLFILYPGAFANAQLCFDVFEDPPFYDPTNPGLHIDGVAVDGTPFDVHLNLLPSGRLQLGGAEVGDHASSLNSYNPSSGMLDLDCVSVFHNTYWATLGVVSTTPNLELEVQGFGPTFDPALVGNWNIDYDNSFPDDPLTINPDGTGLLANSYPGSVNVDRGQIVIDLGLSIFMGTLGPGGFSGTFDHFGEQGGFTATPQNNGQTLTLNDRFRVEVEWSDPTSSGNPGNAVPLTPDSGAFWFFSPDNWEMVVKVLDGCDVTDHFWVFAGAATDVEYTLTVTDTQTSTTQTYGNQLGQAAQPIVDTSAFATCP